MKVYAIAPEVVDTVWDDVKGYIQGALKHSPPTHTLEDVRLELVEGRTRLWVISDEKRAYGAAVAGIQIYPQIKTCRVMWVGGEKMNKWIRELIKQLDIFAIQNDCPGAEAIGRKGWLRIWGSQDFGMLIYRRIYG